MIEMDLADDLTAVDDALPAGPGRRARILTVISGKDGSGKSTIAANVAATLAARGLSVALLDLDLQFGDQSLMFRLPAYPCLDDLVVNFEELTTTFVSECMHRAHGLSILTAPPTPERADLVRGSHVRTLLSLLGGSHDVLVLDVASHLGDVTLEAIDAADQVILVTTARLPSIKDSKRLLRVLSEIGVASHRITAVLNRVSNLNVSKDVLEASVKFPISAEVPHASEPLNDAVTDGTPLVVVDPRSDFARAIGHIADLVTVTQAAAGNAAEPRRRGGFFKLGSGTPTVTPSAEG